MCTISSLQPLELFPARMFYSNLVILAPVRLKKKKISSCISSTVTRSLGFCNASAVGSSGIKGIIVSPCSVCL